MTRDTDAGDLTVPEARVLVRDLSLSYRSGFLGRRAVPALRELSLELGPSEILGIVGPNGSGKSTLFRVLLGLETPDAGSARVLGRSPGSADIRAEIGYCSEERLPFPKLSAREFLTLMGTLAKRSAQDASNRAHEVLERVGLTDAARRPHGEYSSGMARRLAFAQALYHEPKLLILDEPTTAMDPLGIELVHEELSSFRERGGSALIATHGLEDFPETYTRVLVLLEGRKVASGPTLEVLGEQQSLGALLRDAQRSRESSAP